MAVRYFENPLIFVNSTDSSIPNGQNERTKFRMQKVAGQRVLSAEKGAHFEVLNFRRRCKPVKTSRKKRKRPRHRDTGNANSVAVVDQPSQDITESMHTLPTPLVIRCIWPLAVNPLKVQAVAAFHIRRISAMFLQKNPHRLADVLSCRQWSYVSIAVGRVGQSNCVDSAFCAIASKLWHMTGGPTSNYPIISNYIKSLRTFQAALNEPKRHKDNDLLLTAQLLAVYEMLESLDDTAWAQHLAGARSLGWSKFALSSTTVAHQSCCSVPALPMVTDALLSGNGDPLHSIIGDLGVCRELTSCLSNVSELLIHAKSNNISENADSGMRYHVLDRAHELKLRLRSGLLNNDCYSNMENGGAESFDMLGLSLAGLVSLDRLIKSVRPVQLRRGEASEDETGELCTQLLQLELKAADAYPANDLLSAFELSAP